MKPLCAITLTLTLVTALHFPTTSAIGAEMATGDDPDADGMPGLGLFAGPRASSISTIVTQGRLLVDYSHAQEFDVSGFTDYLASNGWTIDHVTVGPITTSVLIDYDVFMVPTRVSLSNDPILPFSPDEVTAVEQFFASGRGLWIFNEGGRDPSGVNTVAEPFGVTFHADGIVDPTNHHNGRPWWPHIYTLQAHPITHGVSGYGLYTGCCVDVSPPAFAVATGDEDAYSAECPSYPPALGVVEGLGRAVFSGDMTPLHASYYPGGLNQEEELLLQNIANWLAFGQPVSVDATTWGQIKATYAE